MVDESNPIRPVQLPKSNNNSNPLSTDTLNLLKKLRKQGKQTADSLSRHSPIPELLSQGEDSNASRISSKNTGQNESTSSRLLEKHSELLKVKRELVLPIHFKQLTEALQFIDESMNFIKRCRRVNEIGNITFAEVKTSIAKTYSRTINLSHFR